MFKNGQYHSSAINYSYKWGVFHIDGNMIKMEKLYPGSPGGAWAYIREGSILNDTAFRITRSYRMLDGKETEVRTRDELFLFKELSPKPDSTNPYIK